MKGSWTLPVWSIIHRDLRKYSRNYGILAYTFLLPLLQLLVIGYAFGGKIRDLPVALVDLDHGPEALRLREKFQAIEAGVRTFRVTPESSLERALERTREGSVAAAIIIPEHYSRDLLTGRPAQLGLAVDNTDLFSSAALTQKMQELIAAVNRRGVPAEHLALAALRVVEMFPYVEYIQYLLPGAITLAIYASCVVSGGILYLDDKVHGVHEGYLAAPVSTFQLLAGMVASGTLRGTVAGFFVTLAGALVAGVGGALVFPNLGFLLAFDILVSLALVSLVSLLMMRVRDPLIPRAAFAILNILLFFPSGAIYPVAGFPAWLRAVSIADPFTYAVHGFRAILLKHAAPAAVAGDLVVLCGCAVFCFAGAWILFPRRL